MVEVLVNDSGMDDILAPAITELSVDLMETLGMRRVAFHVAPIWEVRVHRDWSMGGDRLAEAEVTSEALDIFVPADLVRARVAVEIGRQSTAITRRFAARTPIIGRSYLTV